MASPRDSWATQQLVEFLASISSYRDAHSAILGAVETAAAALEAEVAAAVLDGNVEAAIGYRRGRIPEAELVAAAEQSAATLHVEGVGRCRSFSVPVEAETPGWLLIARHGDDPLASEEEDLLRGMGRVLAMALETARLVESLRERQLLIEKLARLQRSIASRVNLRDVLDSIVSGAAELLGDEVVALRLIPADDPDHAELVSSLGLEAPVRAVLRLMKIGQGASGRAIADGRLVAIEDYSTYGGAVPEAAVDGLQAAMAAPIYERDRIAGSLGVATRRPGRSYSDSEREALTAFAEHASLALNDARAVAETLHQAFHDSLTKMPNRALFADRLAHALARSERTGKGVAVLFADLDGFKTVNDSLGHVAGDELLVLVAERLLGALRPADTAARFGGDEFAVLIEDVEDAATPRKVAQRIVESFEDPFKLRGRDVYVTMSIGIAEGRDEPSHLLRNADLAMYRSKSRGKGRYEVFEPAMHAAAVKRLELEVDLKQALERGEFVLHYQPVCRLASGEIVGVEALARWNHPARGLLEPEEFIPLAEESHQVLPLGRWVLEEACRQAAVWQRSLRRASPLEVSVNVSGVQLAQPALAEEVGATIAAAGLDPRTVVLEITETALMTDTAGNARTLAELRSLGVRLAVDDFGTGYSSLEYLRRFPIDTLKMAKSFVDDLRFPSPGTALAQTIIDLAVSLGLSVVAEGVESSQQRDRLVEMRCDYGQGFFFAAPVPAAVIESLLADSTLIATSEG